MDDDCRNGLKKGKKEREVFMDNAIQFPEGYRYNSNMELFKRAVDCAKEMLESGKAIILYQFIDVISAEVFMSQEEFEQKYDRISWDDFIDVLYTEIIYLLKQNFEESIVMDSGLKSFLDKNSVSEEQQEKIISLKLEKCKYVDKYLGGEREKNRYRLKKRSFLKKLSNIDYELSRTIDEEEIVYATMRMTVNSTLEGKDVLRAVGDVFNQNEENITFICDKSDIEYLIQKLERIKQML